MKKFIFAFIVILGFIMMVGCPNHNVPSPTSKEMKLVTQGQSSKGLSKTIIAGTVTSCSMSFFDIGFYQYNDASLGSVPFDQQAYSETNKWILHDTRSEFNPDYPGSTIIQPNGTTFSPLQQADGNPFGITFNANLLTNNFGNTKIFNYINRIDAIMMRTDTLNIIYNDAWCGNTLYNTPYGYPMGDINMLNFFNGTEVSLDNTKFNVACIRLIGKDGSVIPDQQHQINSDVENMTICYMNRNLMGNTIIINDRVIGDHYYYYNADGSKTEITDLNCANGNVVDVRLAINDFLNFQQGWANNSYKLFIPMDATTIDTTPGEVLPIINENVTFELTIDFSNFLYEFSSVNTNNYNVILDGFAPSIYSGTTAGFLMDINMYNNNSPTFWELSITKN